MPLPGTVPWRMLALLATVGPCHAAEQQGGFKRIAAWLTPELKSLAAELETIDAELATLPAPTCANTATRFGFQTMGNLEQDLWIELEFPQPVRADRIVLMPALTKGTQGDVGGFGFPRRFMLEAFDAEGETHLLMDESGNGFPSPGCYPVSSPCAVELAITRIRFTATEPWEVDGLRTLALSEILVLSGNRNLAPDAKITSVNSREGPPTWSRSNLADMCTPVGLPLRPDGSVKLGWHSDAGKLIEEPKSVTVDLGEMLPLDEVRIVPAWRDRVFGWNNYGLPARFIIEACASEDFASPWTVYDRSTSSLQSPGQNLQSYPAGGKPARFVRVTATRLRERTGEYVFALGELQAYSGGVNRARGCRVISAESREDGEWGRAALTDGKSGGGELLELPAWFDQLERTRHLQKRRTEIVNQTGTIAAKAEHRLITASLGGAAGVVLLAAGLSWRGHRSRVQERERHRERLARDLHDELGSNLGSIALISSFANQDDVDATQMRSDLVTIERVARESADSMRDMVALLGGNKSGGTGEDWLNVMSSLAGRLLRGVTLECQLPVAPLHWVPNLETRREIYLFCKEVLHNAARHSKPANVRFHLLPTAGGIRVEIADDGCGFEPTQVKLGHGLGNLRERAAIMKARMDLISAPGRGTMVTIDIPRGRRWSRA